MNSSYVLRLLLLGLAGLLVLGLLGLSVVLNRVGPSPVVAFERLFERPVPSSVTQIEGRAITWQGYGVTLRFRARRTWVDALPNKGFHKVSCKADGDGEYEAEHPSFRIDMLTFWPPWVPELMSSERCFARNLADAWSRDGHIVVVADGTSDRVYVNGWGP